MKLDLAFLTARQTPKWILGSSLVCYLFLAFTIAEVKTPWVDEGWIASAPANWAATGSFGTPSLEPTGSWLNSELTGIQHYTYWNLPVGVLVQGLWYKLVGFSVLKMRALGILFGLLTLLSWFVVVRKLSGSPLAGAITAALLSVDYTFLWSAADGRMDAMCVALGAAGFAAYLGLRETSRTRALWLAHISAALSLFTHPNGILFVLGLAFLILYFDRERLSWHDISAFTPYLAIAAIWSLYILVRPDYFVAQFGANASVQGGIRWAGLKHPLEALELEIVGRYLAHFGVLPLWGGPVPRYAIGIPIIYWAAPLFVCVLAPVRRWANIRALLWLAGLFFGSMTLFVGMKAQCYLSAIIPFYLAILAIWLVRSCSCRSTAAPLSILLTTALILCQLGTIAFKIQKNAYASEYQPAVEFVRSRLAPGKSVFADSYFGFNLGFNRVRDDARLGYYSGSRADLIVEDLWYEWWWNRVFPQDEPEVTRYVNNLLSSDYRLAFERGPFRVYERRGG
jgi:4-amino-4-deoxy-L-arabinose transferase-like glycosyltransferase